MDPFENMAPSPKQEAQAELARAEADAAALLADLEAKDPTPPAAATNKMPSPYAPGEAPAERDPVESIARTQRISAQDAAEAMFKPVNAENIKDSTLPMSHRVDFAQKIRDAQKFGGRH